MMESDALIAAMLPASPSAPEEKYHTPAGLDGLRAPPSVLHITKNTFIESGACRAAFFK